MFCENELKKKNLPPIRPDRASPGSAGRAGG